MYLVKFIAGVGFCILGSILFAKTYFPIAKDIWTNIKKRLDKDQTSCDNLVKKNLIMLKTCKNSIEKATAFISLMGLSYVLVHTLVNKGNNYDDRIQSEKFRKSLTPEMIIRLNNLEGKYE